MSDSIQVGINKLMLQRGDILVVKCPKHTTVDQCDQMRLRIEELLPVSEGIKVMITFGVDFVLLRNGCDVNPEPVEFDAAISVDVPITTRPADPQH